MAVNKAPTVTAGVSVTPNTLTRALVKTYEEIGTQINVLSDIFTYGDRPPVDPADFTSRWNWTTNYDFTNLTSINGIEEGLDGTSIYLYGSSDYLTIDPLFLVYNIIDDQISPTEARPVTIYEAMSRLKSYMQAEISNNISPIISLTSSLEDFISGATAVENGTAVIIQNNELSLANWKFTDYNYNSQLYGCLFNEHDTGIFAGDDLLVVRSSAFAIDGGPANSIFSYSTDGLVIDAGAESIELTSDSDVILSPGLTIPSIEGSATNPPSGNVKIYYSGDYNSLRLLKSNGVETEIGGGGGTANTGDITFEGVKIIGAGTASGDELGRSTIDLVPDADFYEIVPNSGYGDGGQYLTIDPTIPSHIHIRAGGPIDQAAATLILGGEKANVTVRDQNNSYVQDHHVSINTHDNATTSYNWIFNNDGRISLPTKTMPGYSASYTLTGSTLQLGASGSETIITGPAPNSVRPSAERFIIQGQQGYGQGEGGDVYMWGGPGNNNLANPLTESGPGGDVKVRGGYSYGMGEGGYVNLEGGTAIGGGNGGYAYLRGGQANTGIGGRVWIKGANASTAEGSGGRGGNVDIEAGAGASVDGIVTIRTTNTGSGLGFGNKDWQFNEEGNFLFPEQGDIIETNSNTTVIGGGTRFYEMDNGYLDMAEPANNRANFILVKTTTTAGPTEIILPADGTARMREGYEITIADIEGTASTNPITIYAASGDTLIGSPDNSIIIDNNYGMVQFKYLGRNKWLVMYGR